MDYEQTTEDLMEAWATCPSSKTERQVIEEWLRQHDVQLLQEAATAKTEERDKVAGCSCWPCFLKKRASEIEGRG